MINADTQDLGIVAFELEQIKLVRRHLVGSDRRPCPREKDNQHIVPAPILTEPDLVVKMAVECEIGCFHTYLDLHLRPPCTYFYLYHCNNSTGWLCCQGKIMGIGSGIP
jgi:hypothetical protein